MNQSQLNSITNFIWNIADDILRDVAADHGKQVATRTLDEISADILALEDETEGLLDEILGGGA